MTHETCRISLSNVRSALRAFASVGRTTRQRSAPFALAAACLVQVTGCGQASGTQESSARQTQGLLGADATNANLFFRCASTSWTPYTMTSTGSPGYYSFTYNAPATARDQCQFYGIDGAGARHYFAAASAGTVSAPSADIPLTEVSSSATVFGIQYASVSQYTVVADMNDGTFVVFAGPLPPPPAPVDIAGWTSLVDAGWTVGNTKMTVSCGGPGAGGPLTNIYFDQGVGSFTFQGATAKAFVFAKESFTNGTGTFYQVIGAQPNRLIEAWLYLSADQSSITSVYYESTDGLATGDQPGATMQPVPCVEFPSHGQQWVTFPPVHIDWPKLVHGFTMQGSAPPLSYDGKVPGSTQINGELFSLYPFHRVDCSGCANSNWSNWQELHTLFWDPVANQSCLGIYYLGQNHPVELDYLFCLPNVGTNPPARRSTPSRRSPSRSDPAEA